MGSISPNAEKLLNRAKQLSTKYFQTFAKVHASNDFDYIACIEGEDEVYYSSPIRQNLETQKVYFLRCEGKDAVIELIKTLELHTEKTYNDAPCFGIVDRDYNLDYIQCPHKIYYTPTYSFENFYLSESCIKQIFAVFFHLKPFGDFNEDYQRVMDNYLERLDEYLNIIKEIDIKYKATKISRVKLREQLPKFKSKDIKISENNIEISLSKVTLLEPIIKKPIEESYSKEALQNSSSTYDNYTNWDYTRNIRGKFLLYFIKNYIAKLQKDANSNTSKYFLQRLALKNSKDNNEKQRAFGITEIQLRSDIQFLSYFASCAEIPKCLTEFLKTIKVIS